MGGPTPPAAPRPLALWQTGVVFLVALAAELLLGVALAALAGFRAALGGGDPVELLLSPPVMTAQIVLGSAMIGAVALVVPRIRGAGLRDALGLVPARPGMVALAALGVIPAGILSDEATFAAATLAPGVFDTALLEQFARAFAGPSAPWFAALAFAIAVGPGLCEELLFRGLILRGLAARLPAAPAAAAAAVLFGVIHFNALQGLAAALIGLYLAFAALVSGSVWPAVAAHALNNLLSALLARFDPEGAGAAFESGHPWYVLAASAAALAVIVVAMERISRRATLEPVRTGPP